MKVFEQRQANGSRKLMGTMTVIEEAKEVKLKTSDGTESTFDFSKQYHYVAPGSFAENGTDTPLGMYIGENRVVPPANIDFEDEEPTYTLTKIEITEEPTKVVYTEGEILDLTGLVIIATYTDGTSEVTEALGANEFVSVPVNGDTLTTDVTEVVVTAVEDDSFTDSFNITVNAATEDSTTEPKVYTSEELNAMTKQEIADLATELGYSGVTTDLNKDQMIEAFISAQSGN